MVTILAGASAAGVGGWPGHCDLVSEREHRVAKLGRAESVRFQRRT